jgi:hypothetical protein
MPLKLNTNHQYGKHLHYYDPRKSTKFGARWRWCLSLFSIKKVPHTMHIPRPSTFIYKYSDVSVMQFAINDQANGTLIHGKFIMTMHLCTQSKLCRILQPHTTFHKCVNPHTAQTWSHMAFSSSYNPQTPRKVSDLKV